MDNKIPDIKTKDDASLRAQAEAVLSKARSEFIELQRALSSATPGSEAHARLSAAIANVSGAISQLSAALSSSTFSMRSGDLMAFEHEVKTAGDAISANAATLVASDKAQAEAVVTASAAYTRRDTVSLEHDVFNDKIFDRYLHFSSAEDEEAFRKRQASAKNYVDAQLAKKTPEGDLNAGGGMVGVMLDEHAHGAGASPDFAPRWNKLIADVTKQHDAMKAAGQSTAEYDRNLAAAVTGYLKTKGLSDDEIKARLAASASPLDAVKPYLRSDGDARQLEQMSRTAIEAERSPAPAKVEVDRTAPGATSPQLNASAIGAKLKAAGLVMSNGEASTKPDHGVAVAQVAQPNGTALGG